MKQFVLSGMFCLFCLNLLADYDGVISVNKTSMNYSTKSSYNVVEIPGYRSGGNPGAPLLPVQEFSYIIPSGMKVSNLVITGTTEEEITGAFTIYPAQPVPAFVEPDPAIYTKNQFYPAQNIKGVYAGTLSGAKIYTLRFQPLKYNPVTKIILPNTMILQLISIFLNN